MSGHVISVYSSKGGVGKSVIAANLAVNLCFDTKGKVLLIDLSRPFATDIQYLLNLDGVRSLDGLLTMADRLYPNTLKGYATLHGSGLSVLKLSSDRHYSDDNSLNPQNLQQVLSCLRSLFDFIVIDIGSAFDSVAETAFALSSLLLIPVVPDVLSLKQCQQDLALLSYKNFSRDQIKIIANRVDKNDAASIDLITNRLGQKPAVVIPFDADAAINMATGTYPEKHPKHPVSQAIDRLTYLTVNEARQLSVPEVRVADAAVDSDIDEIKIAVHEKLLESLDFKNLDTEVEFDQKKKQELEILVGKKIAEILDHEFKVKDRSVRRQIVKDVLQESLGLGPLEDLLADAQVSEIMVNAWNEIFVESHGKLKRLEKKFFSEKHLITIISRITSPLGRKVDTSSPMVDARLKDGSRVNAIIPPLAVKGACLTIRKFPEDQIGIEQLVQFGTVSKQIVEFLRAAVVAKLNILVSGGTGSGKTTLLNILSSFIPEGERIITIEDSAELRLHQKHVVTLESRPPNIEGKGEVFIRDLVKNSLRMRPDRIVVGECRGAEALDMLQAMNTGHDGSLTTIHSNSCREAISRLETLVLYAGLELPIKAIKEQIVGAVDIIIQISRFKDGSRKVVQVSEVDGMQGDIVTLGDVFLYRQSGEDGGKVTGDFASTGYVPRCIERFAERGILIPREVFWKSN